jgi:uncharacterized iron-regulated protein
MNCGSAVRRGSAAAALAWCLVGAAGAAEPGTGVAGLIERLLPTPVLLVGEQHDAPEHQDLQRELVQGLAARGQLAALVMEMLEQGRQTTGLPPDASEDRVRATLQWSEEHSAGWPWKAYGPVVMAAVRAGVPVLGGNLPRAEMRAAMADPSLDQRLPEPALNQQRDSIRNGHCGLLSEAQIAPMTRIQIARDLAMAREALAQRLPGKTVLLVAGNGHVRRDLGVPQHLGEAGGYRVLMAQAGSGQPAPAAQPDAVWPTPALPARDHCAELRQRMGR